MSKRRTIGKLAKEAGVSVETIRFYERKGLIDQPRTTDGYRDYGDEALAAVKYTKIAQRMGFSLADVTKLRGQLREGQAFARRFARRLAVALRNRGRDSRVTTASERVDGLPITVWSPPA